MFFDILLPSQISLSSSIFRSEYVFWWSEWYIVKESIYDFQRISIASSCSPHYLAEFFVLKYISMFWIMSTQLPAVLWISGFVIFLFIISTTALIISLSGKSHCRCRSLACCWVLFPRWISSSFQIFCACIHSVSSWPTWPLSLSLKRNVKEE